MKRVILKFKIGGDSWEFNLISSVTYRRRFGSDSEAICLLREKEVWFSRNDFGLNVVAHELVHILFSQSAHGSSDLDSHQTEEIAAEIMGRYVFMLPLWTAEIYTKLRCKS